MGNGCKQMHEYLKGTKKYIVTAELGKATDTYDREGAVTHQQANVNVDRASLEALIPDFVGEEVWQKPPM